MSAFIALETSHTIPIYNKKSINAIVTLTRRIVSSQYKQRAYLNSTVKMAGCMDDLTDAESEQFKLLLTSLMLWGCS